MFKVLGEDEGLKELKSVIVDPKNEFDCIPKLIIYISGIKTGDKYEVLNQCLIKYTDGLKMTQPAKGMKKTDKHAYKYQSTTWDTCFKSLFYQFKKLGVLYNYPSDFKKNGSFVAYQNERFLKIAKDRNDFGSLRNRGEVDMELQAKISAEIDESCLKPNDMFSNLIHLVMWLVDSLFMMCDERNKPS